MIAEVPTMAIDFARISENTGCIHDDMIAQRLGLIPFISTNVDKFDYLLRDTAHIGLDYSFNYESNFITLYM